MRKALSLAKRGGRAVRPNPRVGAVLVKGGRILAAGYHSRFGGPHAEVKVLKKAGHLAKGATLYVTLEPCSVQGKTPPCVDEIIRRGVKRVVIGCLDLNPSTRSRAPKILKKAGLKIEVGILEKECRELNRDFFIWVTEARPYTTLKLALSLDGRIAARSGDSRWISGPKSRRFTHFLRSQSDAVLVGINTVLRDDPRLTVRMGYSNPDLKKIILDSRGRIPLSARVLKGRSAGKTVVATTAAAPSEKMKKVVGRGGNRIKVPSRGNRTSLKFLFRKLAREGIMRVLVEGGGEVAASLLADRLVDEVHFFIAPIILGGKAAVPAIGGRGVDKVKGAYCLTDVKVSRSGPDIHVQGCVGYR